MIVYVVDQYIYIYTGCSCSGMQPNQSHSILMFIFGSIALTPFHTLSPNPFPSSVDDPTVFVLCSALRLKPRGCSVFSVLTGVMQRVAKMY